MGGTELEPDMKEINATALPARDAITSVQISTLLQVAGMMFNFITNPRQESGEMPKSSAVDGESQSAAQTTFFAVCDRLELLIKEDGRWGMDIQNNLEAHLRAVYQLQAQNLALTNAAVKDTMRPSHRLQPELSKNADGLWQAVFGDINDLDSLIVGVGYCPASALEEFDKNFNGALLNPFTVQWMAAREAAIKAQAEEVPPAVFTSKKIRKRKKK